MQIIVHFSPLPTATYTHTHTHILSLSHGSVPSQKIRVLGPLGRNTKLHIEIQYKVYQKAIRAPYGNEVQSPYDHDIIAYYCF